MLDINIVHDQSIPGLFRLGISCVHLPGVEGVLGVSVEEARLSHPGVAQRQELDQVVVIHLTQCCLTLSTSAMVIILFQPVPNMTMLSFSCYFISPSIFPLLSVSQVLEHVYTTTRTRAGSREQSIILSESPTSSEHAGFAPPLLRPLMTGSSNHLSYELVVKRLSLLHFPLRAERSSSEQYIMVSC